MKCLNPARRSRRVAKGIRSGKLKKQEKIDQVNSNMAHLKAYASLGQMCGSLMDPVRCNIWEHKPKMKSAGVDSYALEIRGVDGSAEVDFYKYIPERTLLNGAGFEMGVQVRDLDNNKINWYALGSHADKVAMVDIPQPLVDLLIAHLAQKDEVSATIKTIARGQKEIEK